MKTFKFTSVDFWNIVFILLFIFIAGYVSYLHSYKVLFLTSFDFIIISLAIFRVIRLITYDKITSFKRNFLAQFDGGIGKALYELMICPWCSGVWVSLVIVSLYILTPEAFLFILIIAFAGVGTLVQLLANMIARIGK